MAYIPSHPDPIDVNTVIAATNRAIKRAKELDRITSIIFAVLKKFDGKKITKRLETAIGIALPDYIVSLWVDGSVYLNLWGRHSDSLVTYTNRYSLFLGYTDDRLSHNTQSFNYAKFVNDIAPSQNVYAERARRYEEALKNVDSVVSNYNDALHKVMEAKEALDELVVS